MSNFWQVVRQTADRIFRGSKHSVAVITESIDRQATIQKLASGIRGLERERHDLISTIGKKVYSLHQRGKVRNRDVLKDCVRIDEMGQQMEDLQQQIEQIRRLAATEEEIVVELEDEELLTDEEAAAPEEAAAAPEEVATPEEVEEEEVATEPPGEEQQPEPIEPEPPSPHGDEPKDSQQY